MTRRTTYEEFRAQAAGGGVVPVLREFAADTLTPVNAFAVWAYQGAQVLMYAVTKAGTLNSDAIVHTLETSKNVPTIAGPSLWLLSTDAWRTLWVPPRSVQLTSTPTRA